MPKRLLPSLLFLPLLLALFATTGRPQNTSTTTIAPDNHSPWAYYLVAALGVAAAPIASIVTAKLNTSKSVAELQLEHAAQIQKDVQARMESWMTQQLAEKEIEIKELRVRCDELEKKIDSLEDELRVVRTEKEHVEDRYNTLVLEYGRLKSPTSADIDD